jgi:hypothetical protein
MKEIISDTLLRASVGTGGFVAVNELGQVPQVDHVSQTLQIIVAIATVLGSAWTPIKALLSLFKKKG